MNDLLYTEIIPTLLLELPQVRSKYYEEMEWLEEDLPHVIFGLVVTPFIIESLKNKLNLSLIFNFLEEMATSNEQVQEVLLFSILDSLILEERNLLDFAKTQMGEYTKILCENAEKSYGF